MSSRKSRTPWCGGVIVLGLAACAGEAQRAPGGRVSVAVAPLSLPDIEEACYTLTVTNGPGGGGDVVWTQADVCSTQYGDGRGSISYVGPCDADVTTKNTVILELTALEDGAGPVRFVNPCGAPDNAPCELEVTCEENADVPVEFNLTIMRPAIQGFFDIAVNFDDVFCSAKLDCQDAFLHWPSDPDGDGPIAPGARGPTAIVAFACTAGPDQDTTLYWGPTEIVCREGATVVARYPVNAAGDRGQNGPIAANGETRPGVFQHAIYRGAEELPGLDKCYWNLALGLDAAGLGPNCTFEATATAGSEPLTDLQTKPGVRYPVLNWSVPLTNGGGALICGEHPLNVTGSGVTTGYLPGSALAFNTSAACGADPVLLGESLSCAPTLAGGDLIVRTDAEGRVFARYAGQEVGPFELPAGTVLADACCVDSCCASVEVP